MEDGTEEHDLSSYICPLSKVRAARLIDGLREGGRLKIILGDSDSLKSVAQELKARGIKPAFEQDGDNRFILTIAR